MTACFLPPPLVRYDWDHTLLHHGRDGLHMTGMTSQDLGAIVKKINVDEAECWSEGDKAMILGKIREHHGSSDAFNAKLRLQLMLDPVSYKVDLEQLGERSKGTIWDFSKVEEWLVAADPAAAADRSRCLCIMAGAGKSPRGQAGRGKACRRGVFFSGGMGSYLSSSHYPPQNHRIHPLPSSLPSLIPPRHGQINP